MAVYFRQQSADDEPMFVISVAARLVEMHPQTLRYYERAGLVKPKRSRGQIRLYSQSDIDRLRKIARLVDDLGVNLAGVEVILNLTEKLEVMQQVLDQYQIPLPEVLIDETDMGMPPTALLTERAGEPNAHDPVEPTRRTSAANNEKTNKPRRSNRNG